MASAKERAAQRWLTVAEVGGLLLIVIAGLVLAPAAQPSAPPQHEGAIGLMMVFVLLTYGGWSETVYVSAELKDGPRRLGRIMVGGLALVTLLYLLANLAFLRALGLAGMAASDAVAAEVMRRATGESGAVVISVLVVDRRPDFGQCYRDHRGADKLRARPQLSGFAMARLLEHRPGHARECCDCAERRGLAAGDRRRIRS